MNKTMLREREMIIGVTSTACRLIGLCVRDKREDLIDEATVGLKAAIKGLEAFGGIAGCDSGTEYTTIALRQIVTWMEKRDLDTARNAFDDRYEVSDEKFCASMKRAMAEVWPQIEAEQKARGKS